MTLQNQKINKILFVTLSNIGDAILTLPALDILKADYPQAKITVIVGPRPKEVFANDTGIQRVIVYDKHIRLREKIRLFQELKKEKFDLLVDLRRSFFGLLPVKHKTSFFLKPPPRIKHMKDRHMFRLPGAARGCQGLPRAAERKSLAITESDRDYIAAALKGHNIKEGEKIVVAAAGARSHIKRWHQERFAQLLGGLSRDFGFKAILVGDREDAPINEYIRKNTDYPLLDLSAKTTITQLAGLLEKASLLITNDSAVLHLGSYLNIPVVAIFGPTNEVKYGPWSGKSAVVKKEIFCRPCEKAQCRFGTLECLRLVKVGDLLRITKEFFIANCQLPIANYQYKRILIVRTDRIGDVLLSTPVIRALRQAYPQGYLAMMVAPYAQDAVEGNPDLDKVITYDKDGKHKSWLSSFKFAWRLRRQGFDLAVILHPTNRAHIVSLLAGIRRRAGYDRKFGFLLTDKIKHTKQHGEKHELEYALDLVRYLGITPQDKALFMPIEPESEDWAKELFLREGLKEGDKLLAINPGASCPSKIWPDERFAEVADRLVRDYGFRRVFLIAGPKDISLAEKVAQNMRSPAVNLAGKTSVSQLASLLKRTHLFISNDSGPVHIAAALGVPVVSIFGRNQAGLSPKRWGPTGKRSKALHKEAGCIECLAHNCKKQFACLKAITVEDVIQAAGEILPDRNTG